MYQNKIRLSLLGFAAMVALTSGARLAVSQLSGGGVSQSTGRIGVMSGGSILYAQSPEPYKLNALSLLHGKWKTYQAPVGTRLVGFATPNLLALQQVGPDIRELAVFESRRGEWSVQPLPEPAKQPVVPTVADDFAVFAVGRHAYAYRGATGGWSVLDLPTDEPSVVQPVSKAILVQQGRKLFVHSLINGVWSDGVDTLPVR